MERVAWRDACGRPILSACVNATNKSQPMLERYFAEQPARDGYESAGRVIGTVIGVAVMVGMLWVGVLGR
jgi:hypothetical protein